MTVNARAAARLAAILVGVTTVGGAQSISSTGTAPDPATLLGLTVAASGGPRDTLGLLVATVARNGPADQAGITAGSRILAVNGQPVRLSPNDIGRRVAADSALTSFAQAVRVTPSGRDVMLRVVGGGRTRTVSLPVGAPAATVLVPSAPVSVLPAPNTAVPATVPSVVAPSPQPSAGPAAPTPDAAPVVATSGTSVPVTTPSTAPRSLSALVEALGAVQNDVRRLSLDSLQLNVRDSLVDLEYEIALLRARLRRMHASQTPARTSDSVPTAIARPAAAVTTAPPAALPTASSSVVVTPARTPVVLSPASAPAATVSPTIAAEPIAVAVQGLELTRVRGDLAAYLGPQGDNALVVQRASDAWEPIRAGDVVLQVDGATPDAARLRGLLESQRPVSLLIARRGRSFSVTLGGARQP